MAGIYFHIPFCISKCNYCNFYSQVSVNKKNDFLTALIFEMEQRVNYLSDEEINTIYFGGGTPSVLSSIELRSIIEKTSTLFNIQSCNEITLEVNPDHINDDYLFALKETNINRISIGVQSFHPSVLKYLSRKHTVEQASQAIKKLSLYYDNVSADLIFGVPVQGRNLRHELDILIDNGIKHISAYTLTAEPNTKLKNSIIKGNLPDINDEQCIDEFYFILDYLTQRGFEQYEISNYSLPGARSIHNSNYWNRSNYIGIGPSAHSFNGESRQWNISSVNEYIQKVQQNEVFFEKEELTQIMKLNEYILTSLRTSEGCSLSFIKENFGTQFQHQLINAVKNYSFPDLISISDIAITLTRAGKMMVDKISSDFFFEE